MQFANRLNLVFRAFLAPADRWGRRREFTNGEVAAAAVDSAERPMATRQYLNMLRTGVRQRPSLETAYAIARAFETLSRWADPTPGQAGVVLVYLAHDPSHADPAQTAEVVTIDQRQAIEVRDIALLGLVTRLGQLEDPQSLQSVRALVDKLERAETKKRRGRVPGRA